MTKPHKYHSATNYRIKFIGRLDHKWSDWFEQMVISTEGGETVLTGPVADQAALHGLLIGIRDTFFYYNNWDFNALGTIFEQETGEEIFKAFKKEIADVVEMVDFSIDNCSYQYEWDKSLHPAYQFKMSARDMAKFGFLYQKNGRWKGSQIIPSDWIDDSTMAYSTMPDTDGLGYGYMWKIIPEDSDIGQMIGYSGYYHTAADGYALVVIPDLKLVIVERYDSDQNWEDPDEDAFELAMLILDARLDE